ncbi:MAG: hypothetical protein GQ574_07040 [Crocinitomix sp.]|nr:hypothetical protein [Crocinitomix sp.]
MKLTLVTAAIAGSFLLFNCDGNEPVIKDELVTIEDVVEDITEAVPTPHDLVMVDNQKWVIDEGMKVSIDSIELRMEDFHGETMDDFANLSTDLERHTKSIISNCTMKGQAHDELHKWLLPFIDLRKTMDNIGHPVEGETIAIAIKNELVIFDMYFE